MKHLGTTATGQDIASQSQLGGGGGPAISAVTLSVGTVAATGYAEVVVVVPGMTGSAKVLPSLVPSLDAENDLEELIDSGMQIYALPEDGQIRFVLSANAPFFGDFAAQYVVNL